MLKAEFDFSSLAADLDAITEAAREAVRPAAQAGAQVYYDEVRARVPVSKRGHYFYGSSYKKSGQKYYFSPGSLKAAIYQVYSKDNSDENKATYHISWNHQKAPYGFMVQLEFGSRRGAAQPFIRPAYDAVRNAAVEAADAEISRRVGEKLK